MSLLCGCYIIVDNCYCGDLIQDVPSAECPCVDLECDCTTEPSRTPERG